MPLITSAQPIAPLRIGVIADSLTGERPDAAVAAALEDASKLLRSAGHIVTSMAFGLKGTTFADEFQNLWAYGAASSVARTRAAFGDAGIAKLQPLTRTLAAQGQGLSSFAGRTGDDERLIRLAFDLEARAPWSSRRPATYAVA